MPEKVHITEFAGNRQEILAPTCTIQKKKTKKNTFWKNKKSIFIPYIMIDSMIDFMAQMGPI